MGELRSRRCKSPWRKENVAHLFCENMDDTDCLTYCRAAKTLEACKRDVTF
jgi:hypothetical protein